MKIREATVHDFKALQSLSTQLGHEYPVNLVKENLSSILKDRDHKILLAVSKNTGEIIGYIHVQKYKTLYSDDLLNILAIVIDEEWRDKGVGSALMKKTEEITGEIQLQRFTRSIFSEKNKCTWILSEEWF